MNTQYSVEIPLNKTAVNRGIFRELGLKCKAMEEEKVKFEEQYKRRKNKWFFQKLCF